MTIITPELQQHWTMISPFLTITNESEYDAAVERLNTLLDEIGTNALTINHKLKPYSSPDRPACSRTKRAIAETSSSPKPR
mgnify:CR=1 FL=1